MNRSTTICWRFPTLPRKTGSVYRCFSTSHCLEDNIGKWRQEKSELYAQVQSRIMQTRRDNVLLRMTGKKLTSAHRKENTHGTFFTFKLGKGEFTLPPEITTKWGFENTPAEGRRFRLIMDVADGPHPHVWAQKSIETDDAQRLGVAVCYEAHKPVWLTNVNPSGVASANTCVDLLTGKLSTSDIGKHRWSSDRDPFLGPWGPYVSRKSWEDVFRDPDRRRDALRKGEPLKPTWKPHKAYLENYNAMREYWGLEPNSKPPAYIDPLKTPLPPYPDKLRSYILSTRLE